MEIDDREIRNAKRALIGGVVGIVLGAGIILHSTNLTFRYKFNSYYANTSKYITNLFR